MFIKNTEEGILEEPEDLKSFIEYCLKNPAGKIVELCLKCLYQVESCQLELNVPSIFSSSWLTFEFIQSAALVTNQTPRSADVCLQLGTQDGRAVTFVPRTLRELITSTVEPDGVLKISTRRQLKQQQERRQGAARVTYVDQRADDLKETPDNSVDVVISLQAAAKMDENGLDWKRSIEEAARVLKSGGRFLFVEQTTINGDSYIDYIGNLKPPRKDGETEDDEEEDKRVPIFELVGYDDVDLVLEPHVAGVFVKSEDAGLTQEDLEKKQSRAEKERIADLSIAAYERGLKKRKRKKSKVKEGQAEAGASS